MTNQNHLALGNSGTSKNATAKKVEQILTNLPNLSTEDLISILTLLRLLEPHSDRSVLIAKIRDEVKTCCNFEMFITMYQMVIERSYNSHHSSKVAL